MYTNPAVGMGDASAIIASIANAAGGIISAVRQPAYFPSPIFGAQQTPTGSVATPTYVPGEYYYQASPAGPSMFSNPVLILGLGALGLLLLSGGRKKR